MEYRILETKEQKFLAIVGRFSNAIVNDDNNHDIPDFWDACGSQGIIEQLQNLRPQGKRDLYGLCSPAEAGEETFAYGIGILVDEETASFDLEEMTKAGFSIWDVEPGTYAVFDCVGENGDCIGKTWAYFYQEFLPNTGYKMENRTDYEIYFDNSKVGLFCQLWIPIKAE